MNEEIGSRYTGKKKTNLVYLFCTFQQDKIYLSSLLKIMQISGLLKSVLCFICAEIHFII